MEDHAEQNENDYAQKVEILFNMFGDVLSLEAISAIVISCDGDLEASVETIIDVTKKNSDTEEEESANEATASVSSLNQDIPVSVNEPKLNSQPNTANQQPEMYYAARISNKGREMVQTTSSNSNSNFIVTPMWTEQQRRVIDYHNKGFRIMIILRGLPGCGKTYLAQRLVEMMIGGKDDDYKNHIFSTDDYFKLGGRYQYDRFKLGDAHHWNQMRVIKSANSGLSPIIVDNTNTELWEMDAYVKFGVNNGYFIEVMEPNTNWANNVRELTKRNIHNVPQEQIKRMLSRYQRLNISNEGLIASFKISYAPGMIPPVMRLIPPFKSNVTSDSTVSIENTAHNTEPTSNTKINNEILNSDPSDTMNKSYNVDSGTTENKNSNAEISKINKDNNESQLVYIQKHFDEMKMVELEWDQNESWSDDNGAQSCDTQNLPIELQGKRKQSEKYDKISCKSTSIEICEDWRQIPIIMRASDDSSVLPKTEEKMEVEKNTVSTCISQGDTAIYNTHLKILTATPRDINFLLPHAVPEKIPENRMLDKGTTTSESNNLFDSKICDMAEHHFKKFRKMFINLNVTDLRDIFEKCACDVNWAVQIVLDGIDNKLFEENDNNEVPDEPDDDDDQCDNLCNCLAAYDIIPDVQNSKIQITEAIDTKKPEIQSSVEPKRKIKKDKTLSDTNAQLKQEFEKNINIADEHYSPHIFKIKNYRHGNYLEVGEYSGGIQSGSNIVEDRGHQSSSSNQTSSDDESDNDYGLQPAEQTLNIDLGREFISQLDNLFGRTDMKYPEGVLTKVSLPMSMLNAINAHWIESLMHQLDEQAKQMEMIKRDEDFARKLLEEDKKQLQVEKNSEPVMDFKQIMDEDLAVSLYQKEVNESLKNKEASNYAAKFSRDKLYKLFPDVSKEALSEVLIASGNDFKATVESLLVSTGNDWILNKKSVDQFVRQREKEMENEQRKAKKNKGKAKEVNFTEDYYQVEPPDAQMYRDKAYKHMELRNQCLQKVEDMQRRGYLDGADHYRQTANYHSQNYELNTYYAASIQMKLNSQSCDSVTLEMHYFRVKEARAFLDIFLDKHISKLREEAENSAPAIRREVTLYLITGRGIHSPAGPRLKPAVVRRLRQRSLRHIERNPGLLATTVCESDKLTHELP